jgi:hypothetical protein
MANIQDYAIESSEITGDTLSLKFVPLSALSKLDEVLLQKNYKKHDIGGLWQSIDRYGFVNPAKFDINLNGGSGGLVFGNGRTEAIVGMLIEAQREKKDPPRGIATNADGEWCIPVLFGVNQASESLARALAIDDNNFVMAGGDFTAWDMAKMWDTTEYVGVLKELAEEDTLAITVDEDGLASLLLGLAGDGDRPEETEEDLEELEEAIGDDDYVGRVKAGEIWKLGRHYVACGDCCEEANIDELKRVAGVDSVEMVWADPPYGVSEETNRKEKGRGNLAASLDLPPVLGDDSTDVAEKAFATTLNLWPKAQHCWWGANYYPSVLPFQSGWVVWDKRDGVASDDNADCEIAWSNNGKPMRIFSHLWKGCIKASEHGQRRVHPTQKPIALATWFFEKYGKLGDTIIDPFLGPGMSLIAAEQLGDRTVIGFELSEKYCSIICDRWEKLTGETAEKVGELP